MAIFLLLAGKFVITGGADGSVFISSALPDRLAIPAPPVPESGPVYDVDSPDESMQHDEVRKACRIRQIQHHDVVDVIDCPWCLIRVHVP